MISKSGYDFVYLLNNTGMNADITKVFKIYVNINIIYRSKRFENGRDVGWVNHYNTNFIVILFILFSIEM